MLHAELFEQRPATDGTHASAEQGLTRPKHPRDAKMTAAGPEASPPAVSRAAATQQPPAKAPASTHVPPAKPPLGTAADAAMPGADLPPVIAPPGRTRGNARARSQTGSLSRPTSIHVDDFQRGVAGDSGRPGALSTPRGSGSGFSSHGSGRRSSGGSGGGGGGSGGPSLAQLLSDPAVVAVRLVLLTLMVRSILTACIWSILVRCTVDLDAILG